MKFDWKKFLLEEFPYGKIIKGRNGEEININCISKDCQNPKMHMFVNMGSEKTKHDKRFVCHRCGFSGNHKAFLMVYFRLNYNDVLDKYGALYGVEGDTFEIAKLDSIKLITNLSVKYESNKEEGFVIDLPKEYRRLNHRTKYLKKRDISYKTMKGLEIGVCDSGYYKGRLIFPIINGINKSFVAYSQLSKKSLAKYKDLSKMNPDNKVFERKKKKILNPYGSISSMLLFGYDDIKKHEKIIFIHEGITDQIRTTMHGFPALGCNKKTISQIQAHLISEKEPQEVCIMFDSDVTEKEVNKNADILKSVCEARVSRINLESGDPDDIRSRDKFIKIIGNRKFLTVFNTGRQLKLL